MVNKRPLSGKQPARAEKPKEGPRVLRRQGAATQALRYTIKDGIVYRPRKLLARRAKVVRDSKAKRSRGWG